MKTRKEIKYSKKDRLGSLADNRPAGMAAWHMSHVPYQVNELSYQARLLNRSQGEQMEHKTVDKYLRDRGVIRVGQKKAKPVQDITERNTEVTEKTG